MPLRSLDVRRRFPTVWVHGSSDTVEQALRSIASNQGTAPTDLKPSRIAWWTHGKHHWMRQIEMQFGETMWYPTGFLNAVYKWHGRYIALKTWKLQSNYYTNTVIHPTFISTFGVLEILESTRCQLLSLNGLSEMCKIDPISNLSLPPGAKKPESAKSDIFALANTGIGAWKHL